MIAGACRLDYSKPGKPGIDWDDPQAKENLVSDLVNDALAVLEALTGEDAPRRDDAAADALGLLALVAEQDVEAAQDSMAPTGGGGRPESRPRRVISAWTARPGTPGSPSRSAATGSGDMWPPSRRAG